MLRTHTARHGLQIWAVKPAPAAPSSQLLSTATHERIEWTGLGQARVVDANSTAITLYIRNSNTPGAQERDFRITIAPLSGAVSLQEGW